MRLICPSCDAQYEVPDDVIPAEGRDVQCSSCSERWFQEAASAQKDSQSEQPQAVTAPSADVMQDQMEEEAVRPINAPKLGL